MSGVDRAQQIIESMDRREERLCPECGYDVRGLGTDAACPECGSVALAPGVSAEVTWRRTVTLGLALLLWVTIGGIQSVLIQPFSATLGGILPALNMPGPKLWVEPLLQRPIGSSPELPGIIGTQTALLSLLAVWLITARPPAREVEAAASLRLLARWGAVLPFGFFFGVLLAAQGLWLGRLPTFRLCIAAFAELPAATLLYFYLSALSQTVPGRERRRLFEHLRWAVPATIAVGALLALVAWYLESQHKREIVTKYNPTVSAAYGIIAVVCAMVATLAVGSLMAAFAATGFSGALRVVSGARRAVAAAWQVRWDTDSDRFRGIAVSVGFILFVVVAVAGNDQILWYNTREGLAGNLPYFNFPGPKLWVAAGVPQLGRKYDWNPIVSRTVLVVLNLTAVWLMTMRIHRDGRDEIFRRVVRWLPLVAMGVAIGCAGGWQGGRSSELGFGFRSEFFAVVLIACEVPATALLYLYAAQLAGTVAKQPRLSTQLVIIAVLIPILAGLAMAAFSLSMERRAERFNIGTLTACGAAGAAAFVGAIWAAVSLLSLAGTLFRMRDGSGETIEGESAIRADQLGMSSPIPTVKSFEIDTIPSSMSLPPISGGGIEESR